MPEPNPYTDYVGLYLIHDSTAFPAAAMWWREQVGVRAKLYGIESAEDMLIFAARHEDESVGQLSIFAHGTPTGIGRPGRWGVDIRPVRWERESFIAPSDFATAWAPKLVRQEKPLLSLAACLCARDPKWRRIQLWGRDLSAWSVKSYMPGGGRSLASGLCRAFQQEGRRIRVRAHCAAGHTLWQSLIREFVPGRLIGRSLLNIVFEDEVAPLLRHRRRWVQKVTGELAASFLLGLDDEATIGAIRQALVG